MTTGIQPTRNIRKHEPEKEAYVVSIIRKVNRLHCFAKKHIGIYQKKICHEDWMSCLQHSTLIEKSRLSSCVIRIQRLFFKLPKASKEKY